MTDCALCLHPLENHEPAGLPVYKIAWEAGCRVQLEHGMCGCMRRREQCTDPVTVQDIYTHRVLARERGHFRGF